MYDFQPLYLERFQLFTSANTMIIAEDKMVLTLLTVIGPKHYTLLCGLVSPALMIDKTYEDLSELLTKHYTIQSLS